MDNEQVDGLAVRLIAGCAALAVSAAMAGGAVTGALSMTFECTLRAPHGGIFVVPLIGNPYLYLLAILAGTAVSTALVVLLKGLRRTTQPNANRTPAHPDEPKVAVAA